MKPETTGDREAQTAPNKQYDPMRARVPKGRRPTFFDDPAMDQLWWVTLALLGEVSVLRDRLDAHERLASRHGLYSTKDVDNFEPAPDEQTDRDERREALVQRTLRSLTIEMEALRRAGPEGQGLVREEEEN